MKRRILLLARHYPPLVSGGARRPYLLAGALREAGADVHVIAPVLPQDEPGWAQPHPNPEPGIHRAKPGLVDRLRTALLLPDPDIRWSRRAGASALARQEGFAPDWVVTTSPPESLHAAGLMIKRGTGARWMADFRDSWIADPLRSELKGQLRARVETAIARRWLSRADLVTAATEAITAEMRGLTRTRVEFLAQFAEPSPAAAPLPGSPSILHSGSFSLSDAGRSIEQVLRPVETVHGELPELRLHLVGRLTQDELDRVAASSAHAAIIVHGVVDYAAAREMQGAADVLMLAAAPGTSAIPGKLTEYRAAGRPIIAVGEGPWREEAGLPDADPAELIRKAARGELASADIAAPTPEDAAARLLTLFEEVEAR